jgi:hypothetical protein
VIVTRAYSATPGGAVVGAIVRFAGVATDCEADSHEVRLRVQSDIHRLEELLPRHLIRDKCSWAWGDAGCGVTVTGTSRAQDSVSKTFANWYQTSLPTTDGFNIGGWIEVTSGANDGLKRSVIDSDYEWTGGINYYGYYELSSPLPYNLEIGDTYTYFRGCDKSYAMCHTVYSNTTRRRGFDFVPPPDSVG